MSLSKKNTGPLIFITARLKSKRLKKKALIKLGKLPLIQHLVKRLKKAFPSKNIVIITSKNKEDLKLKKISIEEKIGFFQGHATDVLKRMSDAAEKYKVENFINCTADNPFVDPFYAIKIYNFHLAKKLDFSTTNKLPIGIYSFVVNSKALKNVIKNKKSNDTEIWRSYFIKQKKFKCGYFKNIPKKHNIKSVRLTIDEIEDYLLANIILTLTDKEIPTLDEILKILKKYPYLKKINSKVVQKNIYTYNK
jgi:spore coat polysaccharide biosynthesis protein SpsF (cytidylyltransferase family)